MGMIHINRNRQSLGQFSEQDVADGLLSGRFLPDDLAWQEPMESWQPLASFKNLPPASVPESAAQFSETVKAPAFPVTPVWESAEPPPLIPAVVESVKEIFSKPVETFQGMPCEGGFFKPLKFYILLSWLTGTAAIIYQTVALLINPSMFSGEGMKQVSQPMLLMAYAGVILFMPVLLFLGAFFSSGLLHLALMAVGGARKPYETTFRVLCYASGSTSVLQLIPLCGGSLYTVASLVYCVIGLKEAHRTDLWRPIVAILLLFVVCCGAVMGVFALSAGLAGAAMGSVK